MADPQTALSDEQLLAVYQEPKADLSLLTPDEQQRLVVLTDPRGVRPMNTAKVNGQTVPVESDTQPFNPALSRPDLEKLLASGQQQEQERTQAGREFLQGMGKSVLGTIEGGGQLIRKAVPLLDKLPSIPVPVDTNPKTQSEQIGKTVGNVAQFFVPGAALTKAKAALATGTGILDALVGAGLEGTSAAAVQSAQKGSAEGAAKTAALTAGATVGTQAAMKGLGYLGERVERALVKPTTADMRDGFKTSNIFKYGLGGTLNDTFDKATAKLGELRDRTSNYLSMSNALGRKVDLRGALAETAAELEQGSARTFGQNQAIQNAVKKLADEPFFANVPKDGHVDVLTAQDVKQATGELGAWLHDPSGRTIVDPDSKAMEIVANKLYSKLKSRIEEAAIGPIRSLNTQMSEIIPIRQAIIRRIPVEQRANVLNLGDLLSFSNGTWGLALANRLLKSGQAAEAMTNAAGISEPVAAAVGRTSGAGTSQVR